MISQLKNILNNSSAVFPFLQRLEAIFASMDDRYAAVAGQYGFHCMGCEENCCFTLFYHHTLLECLYLYSGYIRLENDVGRALWQSAYLFNHRQQLASDRQNQRFRRMCPLNIHGQCRLYEYRPMICRLHGIPYELHSQNSSVVRGPGCSVFDRQCHTEPYIVFDRTPLYAAMAELEYEARQQFEFKDKIKLTIAQILLMFE